jgi:hypothetical protein
VKGLTDEAARHRWPHDLCNADVSVESEIIGSLVRG